MASSLSLARSPSHTNIFDPRKLIGDGVDDEPPPPSPVLRSLAQGPDWMDLAWEQPPSKEGESDPTGFTVQVCEHM